ncbi:hypothetical protein CEXT_794691 [Caerostris extrusa]|uniref:Uncharacterized protein n=1 Tax=Caerostris extrusa TaxID=172846 RepID=A0AAV4TMF6_CAEEX|nr:hypothetical protein CEXT_794691 [Caerostris extrusa]
MNARNRYEASQSTVICGCISIWCLGPTLKGFSQKWIRTDGALLKKLLCASLCGSFLFFCCEWRVVWLQMKSLLSTWILVLNGNSAFKSKWMFGYLFHLWNIYGNKGEGIAKNVCDRFHICERICCLHTETLCHVTSCYDMY